MMANRKDGPDNVHYAYNQVYTCLTNRLSIDLAGFGIVDVYKYRVRFDHESKRKENRTGEESKIPEIRKDRYESDRGRARRAL